MYHACDRITTFRDIKCQGELHRMLQNSCDALRRDHFDTCCHILNVFLLNEFKDRATCSVNDIIQKSCATEVHSDSNKASYLCELAESLSEQNKIIFLPNNVNPEKGVIVFDVEAVMNKICSRLPSSKLGQIHNVNELLLS